MRNGITVPTIQQMMREFARHTPSELTWVTFVQRKRLLLSAATQTEKKQRRSSAVWAAAQWPT
jgi:hypothetical protein